MAQTKLSSETIVAPTSLSELLEPFSLREFLDNFGEDFLYLKGPAGRFTPLFPWTVLNDALRQHRLGFPRMRVFRDGKRVPVEEYTAVSVGRKDRSTAPKIIPGKLISQLQNGATLVVDAVDEIHEPLTALVESLERDLGEKIQVNLYAGWHTSPGFDVHWDDHDVIVLQLSGRKYWAIHGQTRQFPLANDVAWDKTPPTEPVWEETIADGDLLYIPRGYWHVAKPLDEPSLHLTIGVPNRTGIDLFTWFAKKLRETAEFRRDLPKFKSEDERCRIITQMLDSAREKLNERLVEEFLAACDAAAIPRMRIDLPSVAAGYSIDTLLDGKFRLSTPRRLRLTIEGNELKFSANKKDFRFDKLALPLFERLNEFTPVDLAELTAVSNGMLDQRTIRAFVRELFTHGLIHSVE